MNPIELIDGAALSNKRTATAEKLGKNDQKDDTTASFSKEFDEQETDQNVIKLTKIAEFSEVEADVLPNEQVRLTEPNGLEGMGFRAIIEDLDPSKSDTSEDLENLNLQNLAEDLSAGDPKDMPKVLDGLVLEGEQNLEQLHNPEFIPKDVALSDIEKEVELTQAVPVEREGQLGRSVEKTQIARPPLPQDGVASQNLLKPLPDQGAVQPDLEAEKVAKPVLDTIDPEQMSRPQGSTQAAVEKSGIPAPLLTRLENTRNSAEAIEPRAKDISIEERPLTENKVGQATIKTQIETPVPVSAAVSPAVNIFEQGQGLIQDVLQSDDAEMLRQIELTGTKDRLVSGVTQTSNAPQFNANGVRQIMGQITAGLNQLADGTVEIRLNPAELGRITIQLVEMGGVQSASVSVEKHLTLMVI